IRVRLELVQLTERRQRGFLNHILGGGRVVDDTGSDRPERGTRRAKLDRERRHCFGIGPSDRAPHDAADTTTARSRAASRIGGFGLFGHLAHHRRPGSGGGGGPLVSLWLPGNTGRFWYC